ncbi:MAG: hypothetical protein QXD50_02230 [Desulfurococcaceae archaeon]
MQSTYEIPGLLVEKSRSRSGKHILNSTVFIYKKSQGLVPYSKFVASEEKIKPMYARGEAKLVKVRVEHGDFIIHSLFIRNFKGVVKGYISIINHRGELVYRAKYNNGFVAKSRGNPVYAWLTRLFLNTMKIPVLNTKLGDEK